MRAAVAVGALLLACGAARASAQEAPRVERSEASVKQRVYGQVLANELKAPLLRMEGLVVTAQVAADRWVEGRGPCVSLEGLQVSRLEFRHPTEAAIYLAEVLRPERAPLLGVLRGAQVVILDGPRLQAPRRAARVLDAAWEGDVMPTPAEPVEALKLASPTAREGVQAEVSWESLLLVGTDKCRAYQGLLARLDGAREYQGGRPLPAGADLRFLAPDHFTFAYASERGPSFSELKASAEGAAFAVAERAERARVLLVYARELLHVWEPKGEPVQTLRGLAKELHAGKPPEEDTDQPGEKAHGPDAPPGD